MVSLRPHLAGSIASVILPLTLFLPQSFSAGAAGESAPWVDSWLSAQTNVQSWSADFIQTRTLKALTQPLTATGHVWFAAPIQFRWELGQPAETIAVRQSDQMLVIYPALQRAERYSLTPSQPSAWRDALALLEAGFPRSRTDLESKFRIRAQDVTNQLVTLSLEPKSPGARRMMPQLKIAFATNNFSLRMTELQFADGSTLRNDFTNAQINLRIDANLFRPEIPPEYKIVEPLKKP